METRRRKRKKTKRKKKDKVVTLIQKIKNTSVEFDHNIFLKGFFPKLRKISKAILAIQRDIL